MNLRQYIQNQDGRHTSELEQIHRQYQEQIANINMDSNSKFAFQNSKLQEALTLEETLKRTIEELQTQVQSLRADTTELQELKKNYEEAKEERKHFHQKTLIMKEEIDKLENSLTVKCEQSEKLNSEIEELVSKNDTLRATNETLQIQVLAQMPKKFQFEHEFEGSIKQEIKEEPDEEDIEVKEEPEDQTVTMLHDLHM